MPDSAQVNFLLVGETRNGAVSFDSWLGTNETGTIEVNGLEVSIGKGVLFRVTGGTSCTDYLLTITVTTNSTPAQTLVAKVHLQVYSE